MTFKKNLESEGIYENIWPYQLKFFLGRGFKVYMKILALSIKILYGWGFKELLLCMMRIGKSLKYRPAKSIELGTCPLGMHD